MAVIVNDDMQIDLALRLLWRESATRENIISTLQARRYYVPKTTLRHAIKKVFSKMKRRRRSQARRRRNQV